METWFLNHVLGLCVSVLLLAVPGPLGAGGTPSNNSSDSVTAGFHPSAATDELTDMENNATSTSYSSESLSPSQRNILLTHSAETHTAATAANYDTEQTQTFTETSSTSLETISLSTEPLSSTLVVATTEASSSSSSSISSGSSSSSSGSGSSTSNGSGSSTSSGSGSSTSTSTSSSSSSSTSSGSGSSISSSTISSGSSSISSSGTSSGTSSISSSGTISGTSSGSSSSISSSTISSGSSSSIMGWKDIVNTEQVPGASPAVSWEVSSLMFTEEARMPQDSPDSTLRQGDASSSAVHTDSTYTSATSRAGERTLLSVTSSSNNSTFSLFTDDSHQPPSTWGATETEDYTHSAPSTSTDSRDTTDEHMTSSFKGMFSESPGESRGTQSFNRQPNATQHHHHPSTPSEDTSDSTPPLSVTEPSTDQSEVSVSSTPPVTSPAGGPTNISGTDQGSGSSVGTSTESSTGVHSSSTQDQQGTEGVSSHTSEHSVGLGLTTGPPTVSSSTSELDDSLTIRVTEVFLTTTPVTVTQRPHITEENTFKATASTSISTTTTTTTTTSTSPPPVTSSPRFRSTTSSSAPESPTESTTPYAVPSTAASTVAPRTSAATHRSSSSPTQGPSTGMANPTKATTLQIETSTGALKITTTRSQRITTTYTHSTPTKSTEAQQTTGKQTDRETTQPVVTTTPTDITSTKAPPPAPPPPRNPCVSNPCMNGGMCVNNKGHHFTCRCQQAWTGPTCNHDVDECEKDPCPAGSRCVNTRGSFSCECPLGFDLEDGRTCTRAKTFLGTFSVNRQPHDPVVFKSTTMHEIQREIIQLLNASLSVLRGYSRSLLSKKEEDGVRISAVNMFSISTDVTSAEVYNNIQMTLSNCSSSLAHCRMVLHHQLTYHVESLCVAQKTQCDTERSTCTDNSGTAQCQCLPGYYKHNPDDLSCLECGDGYKLENGTCVPCMFGFGGFNCGNFYKLIAVVVSPAGGALLLILIIALIVTCCKKDKNDINKIIFKSGDLQMSPYADFPKNNRISMEWGRETIEMQENGSTKNLLQMTDIYYSPALRNSDLERNGLYPFTGLPGSRHSCIYPAQWNPSFISDDSRRRDYF